MVFEEAEVLNLKFLLKCREKPRFERTESNDSRQNRDHFTSSQSQMSTVDIDNGKNLENGTATERRWGSSIATNGMNIVKNHLSEQ